MVFLASALGFPEFFALLIVGQVKHLLDIFLILYLGEVWVQQDKITLLRLLREGEDDGEPPAVEVG